MERAIRTDLALELHEDIDCGITIDGVLITNYTLDGIKVSEIEVLDEKGASLLGKPIGKYITLENSALQEGDENIHKPFVNALYKVLKKMLENDSNILVVGIGNRNVTPDALGPYVVDNVYITRHLIEEGIVKNARKISAICPGVMAQTGIETSVILKNICEEIKPDVVIAVDALAAREQSRLNTTIQICDTGISPGSGVGNRRFGLNEETLGTKVIAIGVPTVISVSSIINDALDRLGPAVDISGDDRDKLLNSAVPYEYASMFVTPKNIDEAVKRISYTISEAINKFLEL